jgi:hypothetical protein
MNPLVLGYILPGHTIDSDAGPERIERPVGQTQRMVAQHG